MPPANQELSVGSPHLPCNLLPPRNPKFYGRRVELEEIRTAFAKPNEAKEQQAVGSTRENHSYRVSNNEEELASNSPKAVLISGMGGMGKTQLALEYAHTYGFQYEAILWIRCQSRESIADSFKQSASYLFPDLRVQEHSKYYEKCVYSVLQLLQETRCSWLLVLDNIEDSETIRDFIPWKTKEGNILLTSRSASLPLKMAFLTIQLEGFSKFEGSELLWFLLGRNGSSDQEQEAASELSGHVSGLPLALSQIASFSRQRKFNQQEYLQNWLRYVEKPRISTKREVVKSYGHTVASVWLPTFLDFSSSASRLMCILSVLSPDDIPVSFFDCKDVAPPFGDLFVLEEAFSELRECSMVKWDGEKQTYSIHRLVQQQFRKFMTVQEREEALETTSLMLLDHLQAAISGLGLLQDSKTYHKFLPHLKALEEQPATHGKWRVALIDFVRSSIGATDRGHSSHSTSEDGEDSIFSKADTLSSASTTEDLLNMSAMAQFIHLLKTDQSLVSAATDIVEKEGGVFFSKRFADLLMLFSKELQPEAKTLSETKASEWVELEREHIAAVLRLAIEEPEKETPRRFKSQQKEGSVTLQRFLDSMDRGSPSLVDNSIALQSKQECDERGHEASDNRATNYAGIDVPLNTIKDFMIISPAFSRLKENLQKISSKKSRNTNDSLGRGMSNIEEERIHQINVTGKWTCKCGEIIQDDYVELAEGSVEKAMKLLSAPHSASSDFSASARAFQGYWNGFKDMLSDFSLTLTNLKGYLRQKKHQRGPSDNENGEHLELQVDPHGRNNPHYLLLCISQWKGYYKTGMVAVDLRIASDTQMFRKMQAEYKKMIGPWRRFLSLKRLTDIRFVQFHILRTQLIEILVHSRMPGQILAAIPPYHHHHYFYDPQPIEMDPPVGHNTMLHCYRCPADCGDLSFCLQRFPKYKYETVRIGLEQDSGIAWGVELVESKDWAFLWVVGFLLIVCSLAFGIVWTLVMKDIQGGFTVAGYVLAFAASLFGTVQVAMENL